MSIAATKETKPPTVVSLAADCRPTIIIDERERDGGEQLDDRRVGRGRGGVLHGELAHAIGTVAKARDLVVGAAEDLHHLLAVDAFLQHLGRVAHGLLHLAADARAGAG